jgi:hypothetical protein
LGKRPYICEAAEMLLVRSGRSHSDPAMVKGNGSGDFPVGSLQTDLYWTDASNQRVDPLSVYRVLEQNFPGSGGPTTPSSATPISGVKEPLAATAVFEEIVR